MNDFKIKTVIGLFLIISQGCTAQPLKKLVSNKDDNTLLWEVSGKGLSNPSFLYGTFHLMCKEDIHISNNLSEAIRNADEVYFEMDLDDPANTLGAMLYINMKDGKSLKDLYTEKEYERVFNYLKDSVKLPMAMMQKIKPSFLEALLFTKLMPCKKAIGFETELMKIAKENKKEIKGFETMSFQASVFDSIPYEEQAKSLLKTLDSIDLYQKYFDTMLLAYKSQQIREIELFINKKEFGMEEHKDILLYKRNRNWVDQLKNIMPGKSVFAAVGAGHLVGEQGVIELLKKEGYILRPVLNK
ncbi:MAG TPA: TraB/GumN family protein [Ferruginibacter sp.]|nr:TraB/GumN family protein [Ferruginibacter sp.]